MIAVDELSAHAKVRMQQRRVPPLILGWLREYGAEQHDHHGAVIRYFNKDSKRRIATNAGDSVAKALSRYMSAYLVEQAGRVITIGYRNKHIRHH